VISAESSPLRVLHDPVYARLFAAQVVALVGTGLATVALGLIAYDLAGRDAGLVLGGVFAVKMLAYVVLAPVAAAALARVPRRTVLIGADLTRLVIALTLPFVGEVWQVFVLVFLLQAASAAFTPTFQSVIPQVLTDEDDYTQALSLSRLAYDLEAIVSPLAAAVALLVVTAPTLFIGTAIGFAASALLVLTSALPRALGLSAQSPKGAPVQRFGARATAGIALFLRTSALRPVLALNVVVAAAGALVLVQTVTIVRSDLALAPSSVALFLALNGAGSMAGALALPRLLRTASERRVMLSSAVLLVLATTAAAVALFELGPATVPFVGVLWFVIGLGWSGVETPVGRLIRRSVPARDLTAAFAAQFSLSHACWLLTYPLAGVLGGPGPAYAAAGLAALAAIGLALGTLAWRQPRPTSRLEEPA
jgi:multisubunit Na+/H+ antiporter MnhG subunit